MERDDGTRTICPARAAGAMNVLGTIADRIATGEGSTRPVALVRIGVALILWSRFGSDLGPYMRHTWSWLALGLSFYASTTLMLLGFRTRLATGWWRRPWR